MTFDWTSSVTNTFWELRERGGLFNPVNLVRMVGGGLVPGVVRDMLDAKGELDGRLRGCINDFVESFAGRMLMPLKKGGKMASELPLAEAQKATAEVRSTVQKDILFLRKKLDEYVQDPRTRETLVAAVMDKVVEGYEDWYEEWRKGAAAIAAAGKGGRKGKGREDEVWGPGAFGEWAGGVFEVGRLGFLDDEEEGGRGRGSSVGSI